MLVCGILAGTSAFPLDLIQVFDMVVGLVVEGDPIRTRVQADRVDCIG